jgi:hypothetical protein
VSRERVSPQNCLDHHGGTPQLHPHFSRKDSSKASINGAAIAEGLTCDNKGVIEADDVHRV